MPPTPNEITWRLSPTYYDIEAGSDGSLRRASNGKPQPTHNIRGYRRTVSRTRLPPARRAIEVFAHRVVADAFLGKRPDGFVVNHIDGNKLNNRPENLEYVTPRGNSQHAARTGLTLKGERQVGAKLTDSAVRKILDLEDKMTHAAMAKMFGVSPAAIRFVLTGRAWTHVTGRTREQAKSYKFWKKGTSLYKGVHLNKRKTWTSQIRIGGKKICLGAFHTEEQAAVAYDTAARADGRPEVDMNFPQTSRGAVT